MLVIYLKPKFSFIEKFIIINIAIVYLYALTGLIFWHSLKLADPLVTV